MTSVQATGRLTRREDGVYVLVDRIFSAPIADVWASLTDKERLKAWIGTWKGSPDTGAIEFMMTEEDNPQWEEVAILRCEPPHHIELDANPGPDSFRIFIDVVETAGRTVVTLGQRLRSPGEGPAYGVGWDYYLDRLVAARDGGEFPVWDDYYPRLLSHYEALAEDFA